MHTTLTVFSAFCSLSIFLKCTTHAHARAQAHTHAHTHRAVYNPPPPGFYSSNGNVSSINIISPLRSSVQEFGTLRRIQPPPPSPQFPQLTTKHLRETLVSQPKQPQIGNTHIRAHKGLAVCRLLLRSYGSGDLAKELKLPSAARCCWMLLGAARCY